METIHVDGIGNVDKAVALAALYNASHPQGMGFLHYEARKMTVEEAEELLQQSGYFDYLKGRVMKVNFSDSYLNLNLYDRDNGTEPDSLQFWMLSLLP